MKMATRWISRVRNWFNLQTGKKVNCNRNPWMDNEGCVIIYWFYIIKAKAGAKLTLRLPLPLQKLNDSSGASISLFRAKQMLINAAHLIHAKWLHLWALPFAKSIGLQFEFAAVFTFEIHQVSEITSLSSEHFLHLKEVKKNEMNGFALSKCIYLDPFYFSKPTSLQRLDSTELYIKSMSSGKQASKHV